MNVFRVVSDVICPWCYIGKRRLEAALHQLPDTMEVSVSWHPFQLNPGMPPLGMDKKEYCVRKFGNWARCEELFAQVTEVGKTVGIEFRLDKQPIIPNTLDAHRVIWFAGQEGVQDQIVEALFNAYFCEGVNLSRRSELIQVCEEAGLEKNRIERLLRSNEGAAEVLAEEREAKALGTSSVPLFIIQDRVALSGAQPPETILQAFEQTQKQYPELWADI